MIRTFNILCPGPSLKKFEHWQLEHGRTIVVNGAIAALPTADFWAMQDWEIYDPAYKTPILFVPSSWTTHRPDIQRNKISYEKGGLGKAVGIPLEVDRYTMTAAIGLALFCDAKQIIVYGADLAGEGYAPRCGEPNSRTDHSERRWKDERALIAEIIMYLHRDVEFDLR